MYVDESACKLVKKLIDQHLLNCFTCHMIYTMINCFAYFISDNESCEFKYVHLYYIEIYISRKEMTFKKKKEFLPFRVNNYSS
jgi:hypothetical protein